VPKKGTGLSREPRIRAKQTAVLEHYAEQAGTIGGDPQADRAAKIVAVERGGYTRAQTEEAKLRQFERLWKSDEARQYLAELWGAAVTQEPDPVSLAFRMLNEHMTQPVVECSACAGDGIKEVTIRGSETYITCPACEGAGKRGEWGPRERSVSLSATNSIVKLFVPAAPTKVLTGHLSARVERPAAYDTDQPMTARTILPAGTTIAKPTGPTGSDEEDEEDDDA
jgi:hypothetical protein